MRLDELAAGMRLRGVVPGAVVTVVAVAHYGSSAVMSYRKVDGQLEELVLSVESCAKLEVDVAPGRSFDAPAADFKLAAEAQRITLAGAFDPMLAVATSDVRPLPHQIRAVYGELLPRTPLRFLLADDPGAGKTIMAGLFIKELLLREDVHRCLIVAPGGLVEQWQDELDAKFGLRFDLLTNQMIEAGYAHNVFEAHPLLIARMDQLSRNDDLKDLLADTQWDLVIVDEAHRMGARYFGGKLEKTKRFQLGEVLGQVARHLLLMTATPHSGKEEDFQAFLTLLDRDRFEGKSTTVTDTTGIMRRMVKEDLLTFEGRPLFPERIAETVPYELTHDELALYEAVTKYVREGMNRADRLEDGKRRNSVGFALTVLQRRLASSPEAIYQSLLRRSARLTQRREEIRSGALNLDPVIPALSDEDLEAIDDDGYSADELETLEEELLDSATASRTVGELDAELADLADLIEQARVLRASGRDRKWTELSTILQDHALTTDEQGRPRKIIVFTEHRDTLDYLRARISSLLGDPDAVAAIHGGVRRAERRQITEEFTHNPALRILLATDAAGEGLNLQVAHLMVNYDLPWNPNRIEQRFGRIHRIGQTEVCRLWNLVADNTREGEVFTRLLDKLATMRDAYGGKVFDVLGQAFAETSLRDLLLDAIQYGNDPEVRARMHQVIDSSVGDGLKELLEDQALAADSLAKADLDQLRKSMDEARARRLQPHYIEMAFREAFTRLGGRIVRRETGRFQIRNVPAALRATTRAPIASAYERVAFDLPYVHPDGQPRAELLAPRHPLHDAVMREAVTRYSPALEAGTVLVSPAIEDPRLLVGVIEQITDATGASIDRRFGYAFVAPDGTVTDAGPAPYLDCVAAPDTPTIRAAKALPWLQDAEQHAVSWIIANRLPAHQAEIQTRRLADIDRTRTLVERRLNEEIGRLALEATIAKEKEDRGDKPRETSESLERKAAELEARLQRRLARLDQEASLQPKPPRLLTAALVLPLTMARDELPDREPIHAKETKAVERRGVDLVLATEHALGRHPEEQAFNNPGFDILSSLPTGDTLRIEVKARIAGSDDFFITHNEILTAKNADPHYRLALVSVDPRGPQHDQVRYLANPFAHTELAGLDATGIRLDWAKTWSKGHAPF
ncbi:helicase-related protein [Corynebacterium variabile]|uniref:helicase-related protein n=1 Tax=Corynebacterium variabile TaxID=1727 RepID=UPI002FE1EA26